MYLKKTPLFIQKLFPQFVWRITTSEPKIFLTFDDGPTPKITDWVLSNLDKYNAAATFFCLGKNIEEQPELFQNIIDRGHSIGNHSFSHPSGWETNKLSYFKDVLKGAKISQSSLFRPPYGRLKPSQAPGLLQKYKVIMWDVMTGDFDPMITPEEILENLKKKVKPGSIIVFHDNEKSFETLQEVLPKALAHFKSEGYSFEAITEDDLNLNTDLRKTA